MVNQMEEFLKKHNIPIEDFNNTGLKWDDLIDIRDHYISIKNEFEAPARLLMEKLREVNNVHTVKYRLKNPDHLIEKIIRKKIEHPDRIITIENYRNEITDLIGLRILHLFKEDWHSIHEYIKKNWNLHEPEPTAYYREGDQIEYIESFKEYGCKTEIHRFGYRSVHYLIQTQPCNIMHIAEIQVRTIFEEAWSEIDHKVRYPDNLNNALLNQFLVIFNRLAGSADEMGSFVKILKNELEIKELEYNEQIAEKAQIIGELKKRINELELEPQEASKIENDLDRILKMPELKNINNIIDTVRFEALENFRFNVRSMVDNTNTYMFNNGKLVLLDNSNRLVPKPIDNEHKLGSTDDKQGKSEIEEIPENPKP